MAASASVYVYIVFIYGILLYSSIQIIVFYAEPGFPKLTKFSLVVGYICGFGILLLVPLDISTIIYDRYISTKSNDTSLYNEDVALLTVLYNMFFFTILILNSAVLAYQAYYDTDGYFTVGGKMKSSLLRMCKDLAIPLVAGLILFGILVGSKAVDPNDASGLSLTSVILTNIVYESFLMFLLAYGLIGLPRQLWEDANYEYSLLKAQTSAAAAYKDIAETHFNTSLVVADVLKTNDFCKNAAPVIREAMQILLRECPQEFKSSKMGKPATDSSNQVTIHTLAALRTKLNEQKDKYQVAQNNVENVKKIAYLMEDLVAAKNRNDSTQKIHWSLTDTDSTTTEYIWYIKKRPVMCRILAVVTAVMSFLSFLGVMCSMNGVDPKSNMYYVSVHGNYPSKGGIALFIFLTLGYCVYVAMWALFQMRLGGQMNLIKGRTTPSSLIFNCKMILKLSAPIAFFYLGWLGENGLHSGDYLYGDGQLMLSAFSHFYQLQSVPIIKGSFGTLFPVFLLILMILIATNLLNLIFVKINMSSMQFGTPVLTDEELAEGKRQLERNKKIAERTAQRQALKKIVGGNEVEDSFFMSIMKKVLRPFGFFKEEIDAKNGNIKNEKNDSSSTSNYSSSAPGSPEKKIVLLSKKQCAATALQAPKRIGGNIEWKDDITGLKIMHGYDRESWRQVYAEIQAPGILCFARDENMIASTVVDKTLPLPIHLTLCMSFYIQDNKKHKHKDNYIRLHVELIDEIVKLRFHTSDEAMEWQHALAEWREYAIAYTNLVGSLVFENEIPDVIEDDDRKSGGNIGDIYGNNDNNLINEDTNHVINVHTTENPLLGMLRKKSVSSNGLNTPSRSGRKKRSLLSSFSPDTVNSDDDNDDDGDIEVGMKKNETVKQDKRESPAKNNFKKHEELKLLFIKPPSLQGWLEKKKSGIFSLEGEWHRRFARVNEEKKCLEYFKSTNVKDEAPVASINLLESGKVQLYIETGAAESVRFNITSLGSRDYKFKASSNTEAERWISGLNSWKDYFVMQYAIENEIDYDNEELKSSNDIAIIALK